MTVVRPTYIGNLFTPDREQQREPNTWAAMDARAAEQTRLDEQAAAVRAGWVAKKAPSLDGELSAACLACSQMSDDIPGHSV